MNATLAFLTAAQRSEIHALEQLRASSELARAMSDWVHKLQRERGAGNVFLASRGQLFGPEREHCVADSEAVERLVRERHFNPADDPGRTYGGLRLLSRIAQLLQALDGLPALRLQIARRAVDPETATRAYSELVAAMLAVVFEAADTAADPGVSRALVALFHFMQGKELAGQERAAGAIAFASGPSGGAAGSAGARGPVGAPAGCGVLPQRLAHLVEAQDRCFQIFAEFAEPALRGMWGHVLAGPETAEVEALRAHLRDGTPLPPPDTGARWFAAASRRIDAMRLVEDSATSALVALSEARLAQVRAELEGLSPPASVPVPPPRLDEVGLGPQVGRSVLDLVQAQAQRLQQMGDELAAAQTALRERKLVERAKGLLMARRGLAEEAAYRLLRQTAMQQHRRLADVAEAVLQMEPLIDGL